MYFKYYKIANITVEVCSDIPISENTFHPKLKAFESRGPEEDMVVIHHHFEGLPEIPVEAQDRIYFHPPWSIHQKGENLIYEWIEPTPPHRNYGKKVVANIEHSRLDIHHDESDVRVFMEGNLESLAMFPTDQIWFGRMLAYRHGCVIHSLGVILDGNGYLFVGHSSAGKSTMAQMLMKEAEILCDDRNIIRKIGNELMLYGTWSHGDVPDISSSSVPLKGIFFLEQSDHNEVVDIADRSFVHRTLLACLIRPLGSSEWWDRSIDMLIQFSKTVPCRILKFDKSGRVLDVLKNMPHHQG